MSFTLLPAVDVAGGRVVRLGGDGGHGDEVGHDAEGARRAAGGTEVGGTGRSPLDAALAWQAGGAEWVHLVDLDAAFGRGSNAEVLASVVGALDVLVEVAGGVVDDASLAQALSTGCDRVVLGTAALADLDWCVRVLVRYGDRLSVGLDVRIDEAADGSTRHRLADRGGLGGGGDLWAGLARLERDGCARYVVTDVRRDGALAGPNLELLRAVAVATGAPVVASGGIAALDDLVALAELAATGVGLEGAIVGTALHAGRFTLPEALAAVRPAGDLDA